MIKTQYGYFGPLNFYKKAFALALPIMVQLFIQSLVSLIDNFMVAGLGDLKMSGVNVSNQLIFVYITGLNIICSAGGIFMSQYNGTKDASGMRQSYRFKLITCGIFATLFLTVSALTPELLLGLLVRGNTAKAEITAEGKIYMSVIIFTFIPMAFSSSISSSLRETGNVKIPMYIAMFSTLINTVGNYLLIYGNLGAPRLEVAGAAYATVIARLCELVIFILYIKKIKPLFYVKIKHILKVRIDLFREILKKSALIFIADMSWVISETVATAIYNSRGGAEVVSGMSAGWTIAELFFLVFPAVNTSIGVIVGGTLGRNSLEEARVQARWMKTGAAAAGFATGLCEAAAIFLIPIVFGRLTPSSQIVTKKLLLFVALYMPVWTYQNSQYAVARAGGDAVMGAWVDTTVNMLLFTPLMFILYKFTDLDSPTIYGIAKLTSIIKTVLAGIQLKKERWVKNLTL
ncbi:MATE family efflux transporter [Treponema pedis]|uniref:MATE family transporter n=1 Tax=Treponema pedis str. T A4 TaxID=1291379 RepID=S6A8P0_9SPIR|nr:MATE family efflux transporter [Treponema pedis]AGT44164.1 MATE family transporter [Treponema pedis str. T A4]